MKKILLKKEYIYQGSLALVNQDNPQREKPQSCNMTPFSTRYPSIYLDYNCHLELLKLLHEIRAEDQIVPISGYRTEEDQKEIYESSLRENGEAFTKQYVAYPKCSEHETGYAIDLALNQGNIDFLRPAFPASGICQEFRKKVADYGFIQRYTKDKEQITKIAEEEWHFRYVGYPHSKIMEQKNLCLEEYIECLKQYPYGVAELCFENYAISYLEMMENIQELVLEDNDFVTISGNNQKGVIITKKKVSDKN